MKFYRNYWYYIAGILFVVLSYVVGFFGEDIDPLRKILILSFMALLLHQFEEYAFPGGFPAIMNMVISGEREATNHYPLDKRTSWITNVFCVELTYVVAIIFPKWYWLGMLTMYIGFAQFIVHGILVNRKLKTIYNPGMAAIIFLHSPIGIYYLWYLQANVTVAAWHWWVGIIGLPFAAFTLIQLPIILLKDKNSHYTWSQAEMERFSVKEKLTRINK